MKIIKIYTTFIFIWLFILGSFADLFAQRNVSYRELSMRQQQPERYFTNLILPSEKEDFVQFTVVFHLPYPLLPFKKNRDRSSEYEYFSTLDLTMEVFKTDEVNFDKKDVDIRDIRLNNLESAGRAFWNDTAYAKTYDVTKSNNNYVSGFIKVRLKPGLYYYILQMKRGEETENRTSRTQKIKIPSYSDKKTGNVLLSTDVIDDETSPQFILNTRGKTVEYTKDFYAIAYIPNYDENARYSLEVRKLNTYNEDTTKTDLVFSKPLTSDHIRTELFPLLLYTDSKPYINFKSKKNGFTYAFIKVPNSNFQNALYEITIRNNNTGQVVSRDNFRSKWLNMPTSLLNLDVAIEMLRFIADKETIREISDGSRAEREKKFRKFWADRDPTPQTEFNELMAEYYRRIDYAYENFSTENALGFNNDRGKVYIKFGPPQNVTRKFPETGQTTEIWTYPNRKFVFRATSGFGDFELISNPSE